MIFKIKLDKRPLIGDLVQKDDFRIICIDNKQFPFCDFKIYGESKKIDVSYFLENTEYVKIGSVVVDESTLEFDFHNNKNFIVQK